MRGMIDFMKTLYKHNRNLFLIAVLVIAVFVLVGCTTTASGSPPPPSGPIGGGCG